MAKKIHNRVTLKQLSIKIGDIVEVERDDGTKEMRPAASNPWQLGDGTWVVKLEGLPGGFALGRCKRVKIIPMEGEKA